MPHVPTSVRSLFRVGAAHASTLVLLPLFLLWGLSANAIEEAAAAPPAPSKELTLREAAALALEHNPQLAAFDWKLRAAEAREVQAGLRHNPELSLEVEDIRWNEGAAVQTESRTLSVGGTGGGVTVDRGVEPGTRAGLAESQATLRLSQVVELGGKRAKRVRLAQHEKGLVRWDYETARLDVLTSVAKKFVELLSAQERLALARDNVSIAEETLRVTCTRADAGEVSPLEATKAQTQCATARIAEDQVRRDVHTARNDLAAMWGAKTAEFERVSGSFEEILPVPPYQALLDSIAKNPDLARWVDEMETREAALDVQRSLRVPDLTVTLGLRARGLASHAQQGWTLNPDGSMSLSDGDSGYEGRRENGVVMEIGIPLPIFDRNQGGIKEAEADAARAHEERRGAEVELHAGLHAAYETLVHSHDAAVALHDDIMPRARDTLERTREGYSEGKFGYIDVLDAQRTLFEASAQYQEALTAYHVAVVEVERLTGCSCVGDGALQPAARKSEDEK